MDEEVTKRGSKEKIYLFLIFGIIIVFLIYLFINNSLFEEDPSCSKIDEGKNNNFSLLSQEIAYLSLEEFLEKQKTLTVSYRELRVLIEKNLSNVDGHFGAYFEDLTTGAWMGINEKEEEFIPASLLKLPLLVATLKKIEKGEISLEDKLIIRQEDINSLFGSLWQRGTTEVTIDELINYLVKESDNTAANTLQNRVLTNKEIVEAMYAMGLPPPEGPVLQKISPKGYANFLRSLYLSSYLRRSFSERALEIMIDTKFNLGIPAGVPENIQVAHKIGVYDEGNYYHDCGIIYHPVTPYILCIMSYGSTQEDFDRISSGISKKIYYYVDDRVIT